MDSSPPAAPSSLPRLDQSKPHSYLAPRKRIHDGEDVSHFLASQAYKDIGVFLLQLNRSMCPRKSSTSDADAAITFPVAPDQSFPEPVRKLQCVILKLGEFVEQAPPDTGPRRFGNVAFRTWLGIVESHANELLAECLPSHLGPPSHNQNGDGDGDGDITGSETEGETSVADNCSRSNSKIRQEENTLHAELRSYFTGSFGSKQRLDYGTGHELSFLAFLGCLWKLGVFDSAAEEEEQTSRQIVLGILHPYLQLIRLVIKTYTLEPAGSHGVWGLDDHCFLPYIFGSAQLSRPISPSEAMSVEGSLESAPATGDVVKKPVVEKWRDKNLYFGAVGFINDVKTGPFWEHSPILFDISGVRSGWGKINKGMLKMFNAEVLSKFPVVQHFPFGSLFSWDRDPDAVEQKQTIHMSAQPHYSSSGMSSAIPPIGGVTAAPWTQTSSRAPTSIPGGMDVGGRSRLPPGAVSSIPGATSAGTAAPWISSSSSTARPGPGASTAAPWAATSVAPVGAGIPYSRVPQSSRSLSRTTRGESGSRGGNTRGAPARPPGNMAGESSAEDSQTLPMPMTKAPWAK